MISKRMLPRVLLNPFLQYTGEGPLGCLQDGATPVINGPSIFPLSVSVATVPYSSHRLIGVAFLMPS